MSMSLLWSVMLVFAVSVTVAATSKYKEADAIKYTYLSISAYCGAPKFQTPELESWNCGPSCKTAGEVTNISTFVATDFGVFGFVGLHQGSCLVAFRGTYDDAGTNLDKEWDLVDYAGCSKCRIHTGLNTGYSAVKQTILQSLSKLQCSDVALTGHSLGGALAIVATFDLGNTFKIKENYNFGSYRVGNKEFADAYDAKYLPVTFRVTHKKDPIPLGPLVSQGYEHVGGEIYYAGDVSQGYKVCEGREDLSCIDQWCTPASCNWLQLGFFAIQNTKSHLTYMANPITLPTDGESCSYVAVARVAQQAYLATAAYCPAKDLKTWSCGKPCRGVKEGVTSVQPLHIPINVDSAALAEPLTGVVRGFVGRWENACVLSLADPFGQKGGLSVLKRVQEMEDLGMEDICPRCQVSKIVKYAYGALKEPLREGLRRIGCVANASSPKSRRLAVTGHGIGASIASLAAFELQNGTGYTRGSFGVECSFNFGSPRLGNDHWVKAVRARLGGSIDRVTHHQDPFTAYPLKNEGYEHDEEELFFDHQATSDPSSYVRCTQNGEDPRCIMRYNTSGGRLEDHIHYMQPMVDVNMDEKSCGELPITMV